MSLTPEWTKRIDAWRKELGLNVYRPIGTIDFEGFVTSEQLSLAQALKGKFKRMPVGTAWGAKWEYGWFRATVKVPAAGAGRRVALRIGTGSGGRQSHDHWCE